MNKIILAILFVFVASTASATEWCRWDGSAGINCKSTTKSQVTTPSGTRISTDEANMNSFGYYETTTTNPTIGADEKQGVVQWSKVDNQISRTWAVDAMSQAEIDLRDNTANCAGYQNTMWLAKKLVTKGVLVAGDFTAAETVIYQACQAVEE